MVMNQLYNNEQVRNRNKHICRLFLPWSKSLTVFSNFTADAPDVVIVGEQQAGACFGIVFYF